MRILKTVIQASLPIVGAAVILGTMIFDWGPRIWLGVAGIILFEVSIWRLIHRFFPEERKYLSLRAVVDDFLTHVRELNSVAVALKEDDSLENREAFEETLSMMRQEVEQMAQVAGKTEPELAGEFNEAELAQEMNGQQRSAAA